MKNTKKYFIPLLMSLFVFAEAMPVEAAVSIQCPGDLDGDAVPDKYLLDGDGLPTATPNPAYDPNVKCMHLGSGDGFSVMGNGKAQYIFSFSNLTGIKDNPNTVNDERYAAGILAAELPAPTITVNEGDKFYLNLTNVGMLMRPDLFDPHTVHWHGFPYTATVFDGLPEGSVAINMGFTLPYFYNVQEPGTYLYHCHVEATEHMQMGMLGSLFVRAGQDRIEDGTDLSGHIHSNTGDADNAPFGNFPGPEDVDLNSDGFFDEGTHDRYAYNDGDGSTQYDVDYPVLLTSFDSNYHDKHIAVQPLPFYEMRDDYAMINGRGYPDTVDPNPLVPVNLDGSPAPVSQKVDSIIEAAPGQRVLLRIANISVTRYFTLTALGLPMEIVGLNAKILRSPEGNNLYYTTNSVNLGGGESLDAIVEIPASAAPGSTYYLYTTNLNYLTNGWQDFGGMMTEIRVTN